MYLVTAVITQIKSAFLVIEQLIAHLEQRNKSGTPKDHKLLYSKDFYTASSF
jgi:hypothetical protein